MNPVPYRCLRQKRWHGLSFKARCFFRSGLSKWRTDLKERKTRPSSHIRQRQMRTEICSGSQRSPG
jgi:hypothetical protein